MFLDRGLRMASNVSDLIQPRVGVVAALKLGAPTITQALHVERVRELQQPILTLRQRPKIRGRRTLKTLSRLQGCDYSPPSSGVERFGKKSALTEGTSSEAFLNAARMSPNCAGPTFFSNRFNCAGVTFGELIASARIA